MAKTPEYIAGPGSPRACAYTADASQQPIRKLKNASIYTSVFIA